MRKFRQVIERVGRLLNLTDGLEVASVFLHISPGLTKDGMKYVRKATGIENLNVSSIIPVEITFKEDASVGELTIKAVKFFPSEFESYFQGQWTEDIRKGLFRGTRGSMDLYLCRVDGEKFYFSVGGYNALTVRFNAPCF
jgi:hypothetical protein